MRNKLIGIFVIMLMITTALPIVGFAEETKENNIIVNQNNKTEPLPIVDIHYLGFIHNKAIISDYYQFNAIFVITWGAGFGIYIADALIRFPVNHTSGTIGERFVNCIYHMG